MFSSLKRKPLAWGALGVFLLLTTVALIFALYTDHRWEDWYITYRASKNVALGEGLVFTAGQRVHSFTSPIGTLIPALLAVLTNANDEAVIWLYRIISALMLGACSVELLKIAKFFQFSRTTSLFLIGLLTTNLLMIDFSINGMETAFMLFGLIYLMRLLMTRLDHLLIKLGLTFAYLMYARPDSFVYAGSIITGFFLFEPTLNGMVRNRIALVVLLIKAVAIAAVIYAPWLLWTWSYYGTPVPHTITAKSALRDYGASELLRRFFIHPVNWLKGSSTGSILLPPYTFFDWSNAAQILSILFGIFTLILIGWKKANPYTRALAVAVFLISYYLDAVSGQGGMPWYVPNLGIIMLMMFALTHHALQVFSVKPVFRLAASVCVLLILGTSIVFFTLGAYQLKQQQQIIEFGLRRPLGEYLKENAKSPRDTVFLECLGYIGFYSNLKMLDYPGMSSPESVAAIQRMKDSRKPDDTVYHFSPLIKDLKPDWLVLRAHEVVDITQEDATVLNDYEKRKVFDVRDKVPADLLGRNYLLFDAHFEVFERKR